MSYTFPWEKILETTHFPNRAALSTIRMWESLKKKKKFESSLARPGRKLKVSIYFLIKVNQTQRGHQKKTQTLRSDPKLTDTSSPDPNNYSRQRKQSERERKSSCLRHEGAELGICHSKGLEQTIIWAQRSRLTVASVATQAYNLSTGEAEA